VSRQPSVIRAPSLVLPVRRNMPKGARRGLIRAASSGATKGIDDVDGETGNDENLDLDKEKEEGDLSPLETADDAGLASRGRRRRRRSRTAAAANAGSDPTTTATLEDDSSSSSS